MLRVSSIISNVPEHVKNWSTWDLTKTLSTICGSSTASDNVTVVKLNTLLPDKSTASTNNDVTFTATTLPSDYGNLITWSGGGIPSIQNGGLQFTTKWSSVGPKTVTASCGNDIPASVDITDNISVSITTPSSFPAYVNSGDYLQLDCTPLGSTGGDYSWSALPGTCTISSSTAKNPTFSSNTTGNNTVQVVFTDTASGTQAIDTKYPITVVDISVVIDTPSDFPAYVDVDKPIQLGCTVSGSTGGDYTWSASGPGNVTFSQGPGDEDPTFSADKPGSYSVNVEFKDSDSDITVYSSSITITVVKFAVEISCPDLIAIGSTAYATATTSPPGRTVTWSIIGDGRGAAIDSSTGAIMTGTPESSKGGPVYIKATDSEFPDVYDYECFILFGVRVTEPPKANPAYVAQDEQLQLDCQPIFLDPSLLALLEPLFFLGSGYNWTQDSGSGVVTFSSVSGMKNPAFSADQPGNYTVKVSSRIVNVIAGLDVTASDTSGIITVVEVEKIQYKIGSDAYQDCPDPLVVAEGADVTFKAIKNPSSAQWPTDKPSWVVNSNLVGISEEIAVTFYIASAASHPQDYSIVTVSCGDMEIAYVLVENLNLFEINANRTSEPVESSFPIKSGEHFELGGTFQFDFMLGEWPEPENLGYEFWDLDIYDEVLTSGLGAGFSYVLGTHQKDDGTCKIRFYCDNNANGNSYDPWLEPFRDSESFEVQELKIHSLSFAKCSEVTNTIDISEACDYATDVLKKDRYYDWRAAAKVQPSGPLQSASTGFLHHILNLYENSPFDKDGDLAYFNATEPFKSSDIIIVSDIHEYNHDDVFIRSLGGVKVPGDKIYIDGDYNLGRLISHELGHELGLDDLYAGYQDWIMYQVVTVDGFILESDEFDKYD